MHQPVDYVSYSRYTNSRWMRLFDNDLLPNIFSPHNLVIVTWSDTDRADLILRYKALNVFLYDVFNVSIKMIHFPETSVKNHRSPSEPHVLCFF